MTDKPKLEVVPNSPADTSDLSDLWLDNGLGDGLTEVVLHSIPVGRPKDFFRVHPDPAYRPRAGRDDCDGSAPDIRGTYDVNESYKRLDIVAMDGAAFIARYDDPGLCPGEGWQLMSRQGKPGRRGEDGAVGPRGERGEEGAPLWCPNLSALKSMKITISLS